MLCLHQHKVQPWGERCLSNIQTTIPKELASQSYLGFLYFGDLQET